LNKHNFLSDAYLITSNFATTGGLGDDTKTKAAACGKNSGFKFISGAGVTIST
jgi:hypothetical protein